MTMFVFLSFWFNNKRFNINRRQISRMRLSPLLSLQYFDLLCDEYDVTNTTIEAFMTVLCSFDLGQMLEGSWLSYTGKNSFTKQLKK